MSVQRRVRGGKTRWVARYRDHTGREHSRTFDLRKPADDWVAERRRELRRGEWVDPADGKVTVGELAEQWRAEARKHHTQVVRRHLCSNLGPLTDLPVSRVDQAALREWVRVLQDGRPWVDGTPLAPATVANLVAQLNGILNRAVEDSRIIRVPEFPSVAQPLRKVTRDTLPTVDQVWAMIDANQTGGNGIRRHPQFARMILIAAGTGMRVSELCALRIGAVDPGRREVHVVAALKTEAARRTIPIGALVVDALRAEIGERDDPSALLFRTARGNQWDRSGVANRMVVTRKAAGVPAHITFHSFRHFYASLLIADGRSPSTVAAFLGHSTPATTLSTYTHLWPGEGPAVRRAVDAGLMRDQQPHPGAPPDIDAGDGHVIRHVPGTGSVCPTCGNGVE